MHVLLLPGLEGKQMAAQQQQSPIKLSIVAVVDCTRTIPALHIPIAKYNFYNCMAYIQPGSVTQKYAAF